MNPFDLYGPEFLLFYTVLAAVLIAGLYVVRGSQEPEDPTPVRLTDPYAIACLRGGPNEMLRVATVNLVERGLLTHEDIYISATRNAGRMVNDPLELALIQKFEARDRKSTRLNSSH